MKKNEKIILGLVFLVSFSLLNGQISNEEIREIEKGAAKMAIWNFATVLANCTGMECLQ